MPKLTRVRDWDDPEAVSAYNRERYEARREEIKARSNAAYQALSPEERTERNRKAKDAMSKEQIAEARLTYHQRLRREVMEIYGGLCACCGVSYLPHLTLDHIDGGGAAERKGSGQRPLYARLRREFIETGVLDPAFQILCWNCNAAKHHLGRCGCQD